MRWARSGTGIHTQLCKEAGLVVDHLVLRGRRELEPEDPATDVHTKRFELTERLLSAQRDLTFACSY
jgi:hypothetical protein